jgi:predicted XRE-type DNA-binding protein
LLTKKEKKVSNIGKKVAQWVDSQKEIAAEIGVSSPSIHSMLTGKIKLPITRFLQIIYHLNPPQNEVQEIFNMYLKELDLPGDGILIRHREETADNEVSICFDTRIARITDAVMESDIPDEAKIKVYKIIKNTKGRG